MTGVASETRQRRGMWCSLHLVTLHGALIIAEEGSFLGASRRLGVHHSALSRRIKGLELWLGVILFNRHPGGIYPTVAGDRFLTDIRRILDELEDALVRVRDGQIVKDRQTFAHRNAAGANTRLPVPSSL